MHIAANYYVSFVVINMRLYGSVALAGRGARCFLSLKSNIRLITLIALALFAMAAMPAMAKFGSLSSYNNSISLSLDAIEQGRTSDGVKAAQAAISVDAGNPLGHLALGMALVCGRRFDEASNEFKAARSLDKHYGEAVYGTALACMAQGKLDAAAKAFAAVNEADSSLSAEAELEYIKSVTKGSYSASETTNNNRLRQAMNAICLMSEGKRKEAIPIWEELAQEFTLTGFREKSGGAITFLKSSPLIVSGSPLTDYKQPAKTNASQPTVSGTVNLRADLSRAKSVKVVMFYVDARMVGITNVPPYVYPWDTREAANGPHTVKIEGRDNDSLVVSEKSTQVTVHNAQNEAASRISDPEADALRQKLREIMQLHVSSAAVNYNLAMCAISTGDKETARMALERVLAANPEYLDAGDRLSALYHPSNLPEKLYSVQTSKKVIALTFDDGPNANTSKLLSVLESKQVKATFFVVGAKVLADPMVFRQMVKSGHEIANHTYRHRDLEYLSERDITQELFANLSIVKAFGAKETRLFRPPGAHIGKALPKVQKKYGFTNIMYTANCTNFEGTNTQKLVDYAVSSARPGGIILMHNGEGVTINALPKIIDKLTAKGYRFVLLSELVAGG